MIRWYEHLYVDEKAKKNIEKITDRIERGKWNHNLYLITFPTNSANLFDIISANELLMPYYKKQDWCIMGAAYGKDAAIELVVDMMQDVSKNTADFNVREYFGLEAK